MRGDAAPTKAKLAPPPRANYYDRLAFGLLLTLGMAHRCGTSRRGMVSNHLFRLSVAAIRISACCCYFFATAYSIQFAVRHQQLVRCHRFGRHQKTRCSRTWHCSSTVLRSQSDAIRESDTSSDDKYTSCYGQRVAVLFPSSSFEADDDDGDDGDTKWQNEAIQHLRQVATNSKLSVISIDDQSSDIIPSCTHLLTAVPCPRTNTYAIAIHANPPLSKKKSREKKQIKKLKLDPFFVDLCPSSDTRLGYRMNSTANKKGGSGCELLLKALGMKKMLSSDKQQVVIYDLTAGLARDSMIMLSSIISDIEEESTVQPLRLHMVERDPLVASLLTDAMRRLDILADVQKNSNEGNIPKLLAKCLSMEEGDALSVLERLAAKSTDLSVPYPPDIVYLDPMFPPRKKKAAAVKKDMAMLHSLLGTATMSEDKDESKEAEKFRLEEEQKLLAAACNAATRRVVVKRPATSLPLGAWDNERDGDGDDMPAPSYDIRGSINRWDVYIL